MNYIKVITLLTLLGLSQGCERRDYITWKCQPTASDAASFTLILDGSNLQIKSQNFRYCGSIGPASYFDEICPSNVNDSKINFEQKLGILAILEKRFLCKAL